MHALTHQLYLLDPYLASLTRGGPPDDAGLLDRAEAWLRGVDEALTFAPTLSRDARFLAEVLAGSGPAEARQLARAGLVYLTSAAPRSLSELTAQARAFTLGLIAHRTRRALGYAAPPEDALNTRDRELAEKLFRRFQDEPLDRDRPLIQAAREALHRPEVPQGEALFRRLSRSAEFLISVLESRDASEEDRAVARGGLSYLVLEDDAIDDRQGPIGYLDDAFVLETAVALLEPAREPWLRLMEAVAVARAELSTATIRFGGMERALSHDVLAEAALGSEPFASAEQPLDAALVLPTAGTVSLLLAVAASLSLPEDALVLLVAPPDRLREHADTMMLSGEPLVERIPIATWRGGELLPWRPGSPRLVVVADLESATRFLGERGLDVGFVLVDLDAAATDDLPVEVTDHGPEPSVLVEEEIPAEEDFPVQLPRPKPRRRKERKRNEEAGSYSDVVFQVPLLRPADEVALSQQMKDARAEMAEALVTMARSDAQLLLEAARHAVPESRHKRLRKLEQAKKEPQLAAALLQLEDAHLSDLADRLVSSTRERGEDPRVAVPGYRRFLTAQASLEAAIRTLIEANLRLVLHIARRYPPRSVAFLDLVQEGNMGLMKAARKFDHTMGARFATYASWWIRQSIERGLSNHSRTIRIPTHVLATLRQVERTTMELTKLLGRPPTSAEICEGCDLSPEVIEQSLRIKHDLEAGSVSLDLPLDKDTSGTLRDILSDPEQPIAFDHVSERETVTEAERLLGTLSEKERLVLELRFGLGANHPHTLEKIGKVIGVSRERVRQIELKALAKLRFRAKRVGVAFLP